MDETNYPILLIESDRIPGDLVQISLETAGFSVLVAENVEEGIEWVKHHPPQLILLDLFLQSVSTQQLIQQ